MKVSIDDISKLFPSLSIGAAQRPPKANATNKILRFCPHHVQRVYLWPGADVYMSSLYISCNWKRDDSQSIYLWKWNSGDEIKTFLFDFISPQIRGALFLLFCQPIASFLCPSSFFAAFASCDIFRKLLSQIVGRYFRIEGSRWSR